MSDIRFEYENIECGRVERDGNGYYQFIEIDTAIQGDLRLRLGHKEEAFAGVPLLMVSSILVQQTWAAATFSFPDERLSVTIPDHEPELSIAMAEENVVRLSLVWGQGTIAEATAPLPQFLCMIGELQEALLQHLFRRNPHLMTEWQLMSNYPGATLLAHSLGARSRFVVVD